MALTRDFRDTVKARAQRDLRFRRAILVDSVNELLVGDLQAGKAMLRDFVNATLGFAALAEQTGIPDKSIQRMLGPQGNPTADNLLKLIRALQQQERIVLEVRPKPRAA